PVVPGELLAEVRALTADKLGMAVADVTPDNSFFEFGADSLSLMGMTAELEQRHGVRVPVRELFDSADTPRRLAERLAQLAGAAPAPVPPPRTARVAPLPMSPAAPAAPRPMPAAPATTTAPAPGCDFSLYFFGDYPEDAERDKYALIMAAAEFADQHGFHALWFPERHFNSFGALFPNPSVLAAALAGRTSRIRLHAGSVVLPLHHPVRVAEEWSVVDN
ncbi:LLM class flavin-dependent oxidoreductase, partial [Streptomyces sp. MCAF7]